MLQRWLQNATASQPSLLDEAANAAAVHVAHGVIDTIFSVHGEQPAPGPPPPTDQQSSGEADQLGGLVQTM